MFLGKHEELRQPRTDRCYMRAPSNTIIARVIHILYRIPVVTVIIIVQFLKRALKLEHVEFEVTLEKGSYLRTGHKVCRKLCL